MFVHQEILGMIFCSDFDGNTAPSGAAINLAYYNAWMDNVSFRNHHGSAIRVSNHLYISYDGLANKLVIKPNHYKNSKYSVSYSRTSIIRTPVCHFNVKGVQINEFGQISELSNKIYYLAS